MLPEIDLNYLAKIGGRPAQGIVLRISNHDSTHRYDIAERDGKVPVEFIDRLETLVEEMKEQNALIRMKEMKEQ